LNGQFAQPIDDLDKAFRFRFGGQEFVDRHNLQKGPAQDIGYMDQGNFPFLLGEFILLCGPFQSVPVPSGLVGILDQGFLTYFFGFYKKEGKVGKDVVYIGSPPGNFNIHLLVVDPITVSASFWGDYGPKLGIAVSLVRGKVDITTLLYSFR